MKKETISKVIHIVVILTFFLPFFYTACGPSAEEKAAGEKAKADSIAIVEKAKAREDSLSKINDTPDNTSTENSSTKENDTLIPQNEVKDQNITQSPKQDHDQNNNEKEGFLTDQIVKKYPSLSIFLRPKDDTYSGLGTVINGVIYLYAFSLTISFLLLITGILIKFIERSACKTNCILDILILSGIIFANYPSWVSEKLWGFWVCLAMTSLLLLFDIYVLIRNKMMKHKR